MLIIFNVDCVFYDRNKSNTWHTNGKSESGQEDDFEPAEVAVWETCHMTSSGMAAGCGEVEIDDIISDLKFPLAMEELSPYLDSFQDVSFDDVLT